MMGRARLVMYNIMKHIIISGPYTGGVRGGSNEPPFLPVNMLIASESERT